MNMKSWYEGKKRIPNFKCCPYCGGMLSIGETVFDIDTHHFYVGLECKPCKVEFYVDLDGSAKGKFVRI